MRKISHFEVIIMNNSMGKRLVCLLLALVVLAGLSVNAGAVSDKDRQAIEEAIIRAYENHETTVDLLAYDVHHEELYDIYKRLRNDNRLPWYAEWYTYRYYPDTGMAISIELTYYDPQVYDYDRYEEAIAEIMAEAIFPGMSQWQIVLSVHDYLAAHYRYDETYTYYQAYDLVVGGTAVCNGYARAYMDILRRAGIDAIYATSEDMDHGWNLVKLNGNWYHVDVTWDDPTSDCYGRVLHKHFLLDDKTISDEDHEHYNWETSQTATSTDMMDNVFWEGISSRICYESSAVSYLRKDDASEHWIYRRDEQTGDLTQLYYFDAGYLDIGNGLYHYGHYGLSLWNGMLYFSDMENVYAMNTDGSDCQVIYTWDAEATGFRILGSFVDDGMLCITLKDKDDNQKDLVMELPNIAHVHDYKISRKLPTCTEPGLVIHTCACGDTYEGEVLEPTGHSYDDGKVTRYATADSEGVLTYTCTVCGHSYEEVLPALQPETQPAPTEPEETRPAPTRPEETRPGPVGKEEKDDGGFPVIPVVLGVLVLLLLLRPKHKGGNPKKRTAKARNHAPVSAPVYHDDVVDFGDEDNLPVDDFSGEDYDSGDDYAGSYDSYTDDYSD